MHAMVYPEPYRVRVENEAIRKVEHRNDAIVRVTRAATRGSDLPLRHGMMPGTRAGMTFSQQFIREVHSIGPAVQSLPVGDRVMGRWSDCGMQGAQDHGWSSSLGGS